MTPMLPVSIKGIIFNSGRVALVKNERNEWELPGGQLEFEEQPEDTVIREIAEELGLICKPVKPVHTWVYQVLPGKSVFIVSYLCECSEVSRISLSDEHIDFGWFSLSALNSIQLPEGYRKAVQKAMDVLKLELSQRDLP